MMNSKKAFALSIVLWIVLAIVLGITVLGIFSKDISNLTKDLDAKLQTRIKAESVLNQLIFYVATASFNHSSLINSNFQTPPLVLPKTLVLDGREYQQENTRFRMTDTSALFNVMFASHNDMLNPLSNSLQTQYQYEMKDALRDWKDKDEIPLLNGAEFSYYENRKGKDFRPRNAINIQDPDEIRIIKGFDKLSKEQWSKIKSKLYYGSGNMPNLMLAESKYLSEIFQIRESQAKALIGIRDRDYYEYIKAVSKLKGFDDEKYGFHLSRQLKIEIETSIAGARSKIEALIDFSPSQEQQAFTVYKMQIR